MSEKFSDGIIGFGDETSLMRVILNHLSGSKIGQVEEFSLFEFKRISIGREPSSNVKYNPDKDDLVSRQHAYITQDESDPTQFSITDLRSRNGTFVNKTRIEGTLIILPGDIIQFGAGGPQFEFDLQPRPKDKIKATRQAFSAEDFPPTRESAWGGSRSTTQTFAAARKSLGKATVERMIATVKGQSRRTLASAASAFIIILALGGWYFIKQSHAANQGLAASKEQIKNLDDELLQSRNEITVMDAELKSSKLKLAGTNRRLNRTNAEIVKTKTEVKKILKLLPPERGENGTPPSNVDFHKTMTPAEIAKAYGDAVVFLEAAWHLIDARTGNQVYHQMVPNRNKSEKRVTPGLPAYIEMEVEDENGKTQTIIEPWLTLEEVTKVNGAEVKNRPIAKRFTGSGFVMSSNGFLLTNRHLAAGWESKYEWEPYAAPGLLFYYKNKKNKRKNKLDFKGTLNEDELPSRFVPTKAQLLDRKPVGDKVFEGKNTYLNVTFPKAELRLPATIASISTRHDIAMLKINLPGSLEPPLLYGGNHDDIKKGSQIVVIGYPGISQNPEVVTKSSDPLNPTSRVSMVPDPSVSSGWLQKTIHRFEKSIDDSQRDSFNFADYYQLSVSGTWFGSSGGPVFDSHGKVIAIYTSIFTAFNASDVPLMSYAVPIKFANELIQITKVIR